MSTIPGNSLDFDAGLSFDYSVWTANTQITLTNVPWDNNYRDIVKFPSHAELNTYIDSRITENVIMTNSVYARVSENIKVQIPHSKAYKYNYVRVYNPAQPVNDDEPRFFYYFILDAIHRAPQTTELVLQLDIWSTFAPYVEFGYCYIERGHIGIANSASFTNYGRDYLTVPEGLDTGSNYSIVKTVDRYMTDDGNYPAVVEWYGVLVASTIDLAMADPGTDWNSAKFDIAPGGRFSGIVSGARYYLWPNASTFRNFLDAYKNKPWILQGIVSITLIPGIQRYFPGFGFGDTNASPFFGMVEAPPQPPAQPSYSMLNNWRNDSGIVNYIPTRYRGLKKLFTFPYMAIELTTYSGTSVILHPELWPEPNAPLQEVSSFVPPDQRIMIFPTNYNVHEDNKLGYAGGIRFDPGEQLNYATLIDQFPTVAIPNNEAINYLASHRNSIAYGRESADWSQQRALQGADVNYDQAMAGISATRQQTEAGNQLAGSQLMIQQELARQNQLFSALGGTALGSAAGLAAGPVGAAATGLGSAGSGLMNALTLGNTQQAQADILTGQVQNAWRTTDISTGQAQYMADTNKNLAQWAARGDYANTIAGINAKVRDTEMIPPSVVGQVGGTAFQLVNNNQKVSLRWRIIDRNAMAVIGEYWLRYGYAIRRRMIPPTSLMVMTNFTYWKMLETYLSGTNIPESFKEVIRGIFEKGVTVWTDPDKIGMIDSADNEPVTGVSY